MRTKVSKQVSKRFFKTTTLEKALKMGPRRFVRDYLFPAMRREHGNGFAMSSWHRKGFGVDGLDDLWDRQAPACKSVMCIGGTMEAITGESSEDLLSQILGVPYVLISSSDGSGYGGGGGSLFYGWRLDAGPWKGLALEFSRAATPREKERVAEKAVLAAIKIGENLRKAK